MKTLTTADLAQRAATELQRPEEETRAVLNYVTEMIRKELSKGNRIELSTLLTVEAPIVGSQPSRSQAGTDVGLPASRQVLMKLDDDLRKRLEGTGPFNILLVVPRRDSFTNVIATRLASVRSTVTIAEGPQQARDALRARPDLVVLDAACPEATRLCEEIKKVKESSLTAVIMMHGEGADPSRVEGLRVLEDESLVEPFDLNDLVKLAESELARTAEERNFFQHEIRFKLQTREDAIERANEMVTALLEQSGLNEEGSAAMSVAFREALDNAARHGNKSNEKRLCEVIHLVDHEKVTITVEDEGEGFDTEIYLSRGIEGNAVAAARERNAAGRVGGLGIMLMLKCCERIEYNYAGNLIKLMKRIR